MMNDLPVILIIFLLSAFALGSVHAQQPVIETGKTAPGFSLKDQAGKIHNLSDYKGQWVLVYFYPKDDSPGCTVEACTFRDRFEDFRKSELKVFGISTDNAASHKAFAEKYNLPFSLLADTTGETVKEYGVKNPLLNMAKRHSFLIDPDGIIRRIYEKVTPADHPEEILADLKRLQNG